MDYQTYQRRKHCWLIFGRAFLTIAVLGMITVGLYILSHRTHRVDNASESSIEFSVREKRDIDSENYENILKEYDKLSTNPDEYVDRILYKNGDDKNLTSDIIPKRAPEKMRKTQTKFKKDFNKKTSSKRKLQNIKKIPKIDDGGDSVNDKNNFINSTKLDLDFHNHTDKDYVIEKVRQKKDGLPVRQGQSIYYVQKWDCIHPAYYHRSGCNCHVHGSKERVCDHRTGQCKCKPNVEGKSCHRCKTGFWNIDSKVGCIQCSCDSNGSDNVACDAYTGQCLCKPGVEGLNCDKCQPGYYGFSSRGCKSCDTCDSSAYVCDPDTGRCVCPPYSHGNDCRMCVPNTWGNEFQKGCRHCECDRAGTIGQSCDTINGQCNCKEGYAGRQCNTCAVGYFNYPNCRRCGCDSRGSMMNENGIVDCDNFGQCPCKSLVYGQKCDSCREATFGLSEYNPDGCTRCFCFGRSQICEQNELSWGQIRLPGSRNLSVEYVDKDQNEYDYEYVVVIQLEGTKTYREDAEIKNMNTLDLIPRSTGNVSIGAYGAFDYPLYFQLPPQFLGDKVSSYGGFLNYSLSTSGATYFITDDILRQYPLVQLHTHDELILDYYERNFISKDLENNKYSVMMHELFWQHHFTGRNITRAILMTALQNVKHIFLQGTSTVDFNQVVFSNVTLDAGIYVAGVDNNQALGVEVCTCPEKYNGSSCQDPANGYYRWHPKNKNNDSPSIEDFIGRVMPCDCNGRSKSCDKETGRCLNCRNNTGGDYCETCAEGFYGNPSQGKCESCPCPETRKNFAKGCHVRGNEVSCICKQGYTGTLCDKCTTGYFGSPHLEDGHCDDCDCNKEGSSSSECDIQTGQCKCKPGIVGRKCDRCEQPKHILQDFKCRICDNCTVTLIDDLENLMISLEKGAGHIDGNGIPAPWIELLKFEEDGDVLSDDVANLLDTKDYFENFDSNSIEELNGNATKLNKRLDKLSNKAGIRHGESTKVYSRSEDLYENIRTLKNEISDTINSLNYYGTHDHHIKLPTALKEANELLAQMKVIDSQASDKKALECARKQFKSWTNISEIVSNNRDKLSQLVFDVSDLNGKFHDFYKFNREVFHVSSVVEVYQTKNRENHDNLQRKQNSIYKLENEAKEFLDEGLLSNITTVMIDIEDNLRKLDADNENIYDLNAYLNNTIQKFDELFNKYKKEDVPDAIEYANELKIRADEYRSKFLSTENGAANAVKASTAYANISLAIEAAKEMSIDAVEAAEKANDKTDPLDGDSIIKRSENSLEISINIRNRALKEVEKADDLNTTMAQKEKNVENIKNSMWKFGIVNNDLLSNLSTISNEKTMKEIRQSIDRSTIVSDQMKEVRKEAVSLNTDVYKLRLKLANLEPEWDSKFGMAEENVSKTLSNIRNANSKLSGIEIQTKKQNEEFKHWNNSISSKLQDLRDKIARAKHAAEGIRVSIESKDPKCVRSYIPLTFGPSTTTTIMMSIALSANTGNSPLLFIQGDDRKFVALEMVKRKIRLIWNLGGEVGVMTHPIEIQPRDPKYDDAWYHIEANRTLNICSLNVRRMTNNGALASSTASSRATSPEYTRLTIDPNTRIWVGGVPEDIKPSEILSNNGLGVVLHQLYIDQRQIGLWHFASSNGECGGAMLGAQENSPTLSARNFNGDGYAVLTKTRSRQKKNSFDLQLTFKTLDENALLFLALDDKNNRSISLTLYEGRVVFRIDYGGESKLEINTTKKYNAGTWVNVDAGRIFSPKRNTENGSLKVNNEDPRTGAPTSPINSGMLPDLNNATYYLGGVPPGFKSGTTKAPGADHAFLGCMKDVQIQGETYDPLDSSTNFGIEPSCKDIITKAGFYGNGYVEFPSHSLRKRANFGFVFRTLQPDCLLLLSAYPPDISDQFDSKDLRGNYSISLVEGRAHLWMDAGRGRIELISNVTLNDGEYHVISVIKTARKIELRIDDEYQTSKNLPSSPVLVNMPEEGGGLYIGGAPDIPVYDPLAKSFAGFEGAITNIVFNNKTISFDQALNFTNVQMGRTGPNMGSDGLHMVLMKTEPIGRSFKPPPEGCHRVGSYSYEPNAFKYGDKPRSHSVVSVAMRHLWQRNFNIQFDFRTYYPNGVLFVAPGSKEKQKHFIVLNLRDGILSLIIRGRRKEELPLPVKLNDGQWHHVILNSMKKKATLSVEIGTSRQHSSAQIKLPKKLNAANTIYVGGIPDDNIALPLELMTKLEEFKGCLRRFSINNSTQDLARPGRHLNVGQCFPRIEQGSYFPGDAYAVYKRSFNVGKFTELDLEFRTSELNGILISVADPVGFPALSLEVHNGNVVMSADVGDGNPFHVETNLPSKYTLCDNRWHNISALYEGQQIAIRIDNYSSNIARSPNSNSSGKVHTKAPLYIGGLPDTAATGTLLMRENFKGCIRNVVIRDDRKDWTDMDSLHNVLLSECLAIN